ncbi:hypothetical protein ACGFIF_32530 [Kribbella sp. NPDC049174]|uniref:hypothetical protein n=1 Tax=Kribbella sp. NPDC049174 TaxID=3364112 RepID=UPI0037186068
MADNPKRITRRHREWQAWTGTTADLERIAKVMSQLMDQRRESLVAKYEAEHPKPTAPVDEEKAAEDVTATVYFELMDYKSAMQQRDAELERLNDVGVRFSLVDNHSDEVIGDPAAVLMEFDKRTYRALTFEGRFPPRHYGESLSIKMNRSTPAPGVKFEVESVDPGWAKQAMAEISEEIDHGAPWWGFFRSMLGTVIFNLIVYLMVVVTFSLLVDLADWKNKYWIAAAAAGVFVIAMQVVESSFRLIFPPVEIVAEGEKPRGARVIPYLVALALAAVVSVAVNTIGG